MNSGIDAVNYCHTRALYLHQLEEAQYRANRNNTVELVLFVNHLNNVVDETTIYPEKGIAENTMNLWR